MIILLTEHQYFKMNADQLFKSYANIYTRVYKADNAYKVWKKKDNARKEKVNVRIDKKELKYAKKLGWDCSVKRIFCMHCKDRMLIQNDYYMHGHDYNAGNRTIVFCGIVCAELQALRVPHRVEICRGQCR